MKHTSEGFHSGFETQGKHHQKGLMSSKEFYKKTKGKNLLVSNWSIWRLKCAYVCEEPYQQIVHIFEFY